MIESDKLYHIVNGTSVHWRWIDHSYWREIQLRVVLQFEYMERRKG